jgi:polysaccharide deacetylase 2 family uncharacterized protein YibQ
MNDIGGTLRGRRKLQTRLGWAGNAGTWASFAIAFAGVAIGAFATYIGEHGAAARASRAEAVPGYDQASSAEDNAYKAREKIVQTLLTGAPLERLPVPAFTPMTPAKPKIIIILDDMGLDRAAFGKVLALPGPLTLSFLPYAHDVNELADAALAHGNEIMLHLPMQPQGSADPGPHALKTGMTGASFIKELEWNLDRFDGYVGVNNHMGSQLTTDEAAMKTVLAYLKYKNLFFLDSVTTGDTVVRSAGSRVGARIYSRDVFLDAETGNREAVVRQLALVEKIARETGYAVAIGHPYKITIETLGPWLATAPFRGFEIVSVSRLADISKPPETPVMAAAPALRL